MSALRTAAFAIALGFGACLPASAATLKNGDAVDHKLQITIDDKSEEVVVAAGARVNVCPKLCTIKIDGKEESKADSPDVLWIENGKLVKSLE